MANAVGLDDGETLPSELVKHGRLAGTDPTPEDVRYVLRYGGLRYPLRRLNVTVSHGLDCTLRL